MKKVASSHRLAINQGSLKAAGPMVASRKPCNQKQSEAIPESNQKQSEAEVVRWWRRGSPALVRIDPSAG